MIEIGPNEQIYPAAKLAACVDVLADERIPPEEMLADTRLSAADLASPATRVSLNQLLEGYRAALRLTHDPRLAYRAGLRFHVSTYGLYGFALLSSTDFRRTMDFAVRYHQLAAPLVEIAFREQGDRGIWTISPIPHPLVSGALYRFLVELQFGIHTSMHRDVMGEAFGPRELHVTYGEPPGRDLAELFGLKMLFGQPENRFVFDAAWLDSKPKLGDRITHAAVTTLCDSLLTEMQQSVGAVGKVRRALFANLMRPLKLEEVAQQLDVSGRTLRRRLEDEGASFRQVVDDLRRDVAIKYLRDTALTVEDVADALGFSEPASFRHAFRRWTKMSPTRFRMMSGWAPQRP